MKNERKRRLGLKNGMNKLRVDDVRLIRELTDFGASQAELARMFKVERSTVHRVVHGKTWAHIE